jgi:hypothetical protein
MKITPSKESGNSRTGTLSNITVEEITTILGFGPNCEDDPAKVVNSWGFDVTLEDGKSFHCGIWDYKGSHHLRQFSCDGPATVLKTLFGNRYL